MATVSPTTDFAGSRPAMAVPMATTRDPRLDFYRGIAMFIILVAHIPDNTWANWIPARFGFSDATEIFVFCSGMASAIAFGGTFVRRGWWMGAARVAYRCWQVYWAHIGLFFFVAMMMAAIDLTGRYEMNYVDSLNLQHFFDDPRAQIVHLFTLTYVPNYFDILPMYLGVLALMPLMMLVSRYSLWGVAALSIAIWALANFVDVGFPAESWSNREWFFNPLGWQLLFFTGFAFMRGWLPAPPVSKTLIWICIAFLVLSAPLGSWKVFTWVDAVFPVLGDWMRGIWKTFEVYDAADGFSFRDKTDFAILRYMHFLSLAYLAWVIAGEHGSRLTAIAAGSKGITGQALLKIITKVGQQSLAVFVFSMAIARFLGFLLDQIGRDFASYALINISGFVLITCAAYIAAWFKSQPWKSKRL